MGTPLTVYGFWYINSFIALYHTYEELKSDGPCRNLGAIVSERCIVSMRN